MTRRWRKRSRGMLQAVGLQVELDTPEWGTFLDNSQRSLMYDFYIASMAPDNLDPDYALFPWFRSDTSFIKYSNPKVDDLLAQGAAATDPAEQEKIYTELQTYSVEGSALRAALCGASTLGEGERT